MFASCRTLSPIGWVTRAREPAGDGDGEGLGDGLAAMLGDGLTGFIAGLLVGLVSGLTVLVSGLGDGSLVKLGRGGRVERRVSK